MKNVIIKNIDADIVRAPRRGFAFVEVWGNSIGGIIISGTKKTMIENLTLENIKLSLKENDVRELIKTENVENLTLDL